MSATKLTRIERAVLLNVFRGNRPWDGRTEAGKIATITGCLNACARLRRYGFVGERQYALTIAGHLALGAVKP